MLIADDDLHVSQPLQTFQKRSFHGYRELIRRSVWGWEGLPTPLLPPLAQSTHLRPGVTQQTRDISHYPHALPSFVPLIYLISSPRLSRKPLAGYSSRPAFCRM